VRTRPSASADEDGVSVLIIPLSLPGVTRRRLPTSGVLASGSTYLAFEDVRVPAREHLLHRPGAGLQVIFSNFNPERVSLAVAALRMARTCVQDAYDHAAVRETFGEPLLARGVVREKFARMGELIEGAWAFTEMVAWLTEQERRRGAGARSKVGGMTALLKVMSTRCLEVCSREAQQVMGGLGYTRSGKGARIEAISRDVRVFVVGE
jgi:alkylation response protein AidB-like acyl-CoA dehydrogenase